MIALLATGGTVAGVGDESGGYKAGILGVDELLKRIEGKLSVNLRQKFGEIHTEQIANIDSCDMTDEIWLKLAKRCKELSPKVDGIVITHGTDTMEETAFFLSLVLEGKIPIILTGAMRPATSADYDGARNLYNALLLANSQGLKGVFVAMGEQIFSAKKVQKTHTLNVNAFEFGELGLIKDGNVILNEVGLKMPAKKAEFDISNLEKLPKVDILYTYSNDGSAVAARSLFEAGTKGLVIAGSGAGSIHAAQKNALKELLKKGLKVAVSSRVGAGFVAVSSEDKRLGFISAQNLNPQKARVLLMLALTKTSDNAKIAEYFKKC